MLRNLYALGFVVVLCLAVGLKEPRFFQPMSIESVLLWMPLITVVAMGQLLVIATGGIDISVGSLLGFCGIAVGLVLKSDPHLPVVFAFAYGAGFGIALGFINAALIAWARVSPLIVTIGTLAAFRGLAFMVSKGDQIDSSMVPDSLTSLANHGIKIAGVNLSWLLVIALVISLVTALVLRYTAFGRNVYAFGSNPAAARLRGIPGKAITFWVYVISGALAGLAGTMYAARFGFVNPLSAGQNFELTVIAAVAIGGAKLTGGTGSVLGVLLGCLLLSCINVALSVLGIDSNWQMLAYGVVILVAIVIDGIVQRRRAA
ncbi:MAG TPA: ABC transporter permease [Fimbriimonadaceae bacterium]|nr:ABC transporter permease [Fimbriimonadaceae bacterium]